MSPDAQRACLAIFMRWPEAGVTKTRLLPVLGAEGAAALHRKLAEHTASIAREFRDVQSAQLVIYFTGGSPERMHAWLGEDIALRAQANGDLGSRLCDAFERECDQHDHVFAIGADCPTLTPAILRQAAAALQTHDVVLGPAEDGGYYLIGLKQPQPSLFEDIAWGESSVCRDTEVAAARVGLRVAKLPVLSDVDRPEDLAFCDL